MRAGRNDPCPCGSGKKYKNCCLSKDMDKPPEPLVPTAPRWRPEPEPAPVASWRDEPELYKAPEPEVSRKDDPALAANIARWEEFEKADYAEQLSLFARTLDEGLMDGENALSMLEVLFNATLEHNERDRFLALADAVDRQAPEAFAEHDICFLGWQITTALALRREDVLPELTGRVGGLAATDADGYSLIVQQLNYLGRLDLLLPMMRQAWPGLRDNEDIMEWAIDEYREWGAALEIYSFLDAEPQGEGTDAALIERVDFFVEDLEVDRLSRHVGLLTGRLAPSEQLDDYRTRSSGKKHDRDEFNAGVHERMIDLSVGFIGHAHREEGVPWTKARQAALEIVDYLLAQADPERRKKSALRHPLCPEHVSLDPYLAGHLNLFNFQLHAVFAAFELLPAWLRFLRRHTLLTEQQHRDAFADLERLRRPLTDLLTSNRSEPRLGEGLSAWDAPPLDGPAGGP